MSSRSLKHWPTSGFHLDESNFGNGPDWLVPECWNTRTPIILALSIPFWSGSLPATEHNAGFVDAPAKGDSMIKTNGTNTILKPNVMLKP